MPWIQEALEVLVELQAEQDIQFSEPFDLPASSEGEGGVMFGITIGDTHIATLTKQHGRAVTIFAINDARARPLIGDMRIIAERTNTELQVHERFVPVGA